MIKIIKMFILYIHQRVMCYQNIHSLHPPEGYVVGAFIYLFVFAISPIVTGDHVLMQCIPRRDTYTENSNMQNITGDACKLFCEYQIPRSNSKEVVRVFNINPVHP